MRLEFMKFLEVDGLGLVSRVGLGTWQFGSREWGYGEGYASGAAGDIVRRARELGVTLFDTAEVYGFGKSEKILGEALGADRDQVVVASKVFPVAPFPPVVRARGESSARRLQLRRIPLYQVHQPNPLVPDSVIMPGMRDLPERGRIGAVGVSNYSLSRWRQADTALGRPVISNQVQFNLAQSAPLADMVPFAERENRMVMAYSPLAQGLLGGKYSVDNRPGGVRAMNPLFGSENLRRVEPLLSVLRGRHRTQCQARAGGAGLVAGPAAGGGYCRRVQCRATGVQCGGGRPDSRRRCTRRADGRRAGIHARVGGAQPAGRGSREARRLMPA